MFFIKPSELPAKSNSQILRKQGKLVQIQVCKIRYKSLDSNDRSQKVFYIVFVVCFQPESQRNLSQRL